MRGGRDTGRGDRDGPDPGVHAASEVEGERLPGEGGVALPGEGAFLRRGVGEELRDGADDVGGDLPDEPIIDLMPSMNPPMSAFPELNSVLPSPDRTATAFPGRLFTNSIALPTPERRRRRRSGSTRPSRS
jgi:hypothetical protein